MPLRFPILFRRAEPEPARTFRDVVARWLRLNVGRAWGREATRHRTHNARTWCRLIGEIPMGQVGPLEIQSIYEVRDNGKRSGFTLNSEREHLKAFWAWARSMELVERSFPEAAWPRKRRPLKKRVYHCYSQEEEDRLCLFLRPPFVRFVRFDIASGLRWGELRKLVWAWIVEGPEGILFLDIPAWARKQRMPLKVPLSAKAVAALGPRGAPEAHVFADLPSCQAVGRALKRAAERAGVPQVISPHQLRRTFSGRLQRAGVALPLIKLLGGWASEATIEGFYTAPLTPREALGLLNRI